MRNPAHPMPAMRAHARIRGWAASAVLVGLGVVALLPTACGSGPALSDTPPGGSLDGSLSGGGCSHPQAGCACDKAGAVADCGKVEVRAGSYVQCSMGKITCDGNKWGACIGDLVTTRAFSGGGLRLQSLGSSMPCGNPCDPYCNGFSDNPGGLAPDSGLVVGEGGLTIPSDGGVAVSGGNSSVNTSGPDGLNHCLGAVNSLTNPCNVAPGPYRNCQQDFHCTATNSCQWNVPSNYVDPACNGVDLTVGAGCDLGGGGYSLPVCNRGNQALPTGNVLTIQFQAASAWAAACPDLGTAYACTHTLVAPLGPGQCVNVTGCARPAGPTYAIVNGHMTISECAGAGGCLNNSAAVDDTLVGCNACACPSGDGTLVGKILDPANLRPVYGVAVYVPVGSVAAFTPGIGCDTCSNIFGTASTSAVTAADGTFRLTGIPAGANFPLVIQLGRWRRQFTVPAIAACGTATLSAAQGHLPAHHAKGIAGTDEQTDTANPDIPKMALVIGNGDASECLFAKMGLSPATEFGAPGGTAPIELYEYALSNGVTGAPGAFSGLGQKYPSAGAADALLANSANLNNYNILVVPCTNQPTVNPTVGMQTNLETWVNKGGRLFTSHKGPYDWIHYPLGNSFDTVVTWANVDPWNSPPDTTDRSSTNSLTDTINTGFADGKAMADWMQAAWPAPGGPGGALPAYAQLPLPDYRHDVASVGANGLSWISGSSTGPGSGAGVSQVNIFSFDAPVGAAAASQCGRVVAPFMHVSSASDPTKTFPAGCPAGGAAGALGPQELAFEFMLFESMNCLAPTPTPPPPSNNLNPASFTRDYHAVCPAGTHVVWQLFEWEANVPPNTNVTFTGQTAPDTDGGPGTYGPSVPIGMATNANTGTAGTMFYSDACTVDQHLQNLTALSCPGVSPPQRSQDWLRVTMTLNPAGPISPALLQWTQTYDCPPSE
jgi:hypothetical protein